MIRTGLLGYGCAVDGTASDSSTPMLARIFRITIAPVYARTLLIRS
jgi:hypothetical protein